MSSPGAPDVPQKASSGESLNLLEKVQKGQKRIHVTSIIILAINGGFVPLCTVLPEMYATEALHGSDASRKDAPRVGRRVESWFELSCVE